MSENRTQAPARKRRRSDIHARKLRKLIGRRAERRFAAAARDAHLEA